MGFQKNELYNNFLTMSSSSPSNIFNEIGECSLDVVYDDEGDIYNNTITNNNDNEMVIYKSSNNNVPLISSTTKNRVNFAMKVRVREILSLNEYTMEEIQNCWYTPKEKRVRALKRERTIARMEAGMPVKGDHMTYRGLEGWTAQRGKKINQQILNCVDAVMEEQNHQWKIDQDGFVRIADISRKFSSVTKEEALQRATDDRNEAVKALKGRWKSTVTTPVSSSTPASDTTASSSSSLPVCLQALKQQASVVVSAKTKNKHLQQKQRQQSNRRGPPGILLRAA